MKCYNCNQDIPDGYITIGHSENGETQVFSYLHVHCYNEIVKYLEAKRAQWEADQVPANRSSRLSGQAPSTRT